MLVRLQLNSLPQLKINLHAKLKIFLKETKWPTLLARDGSHTCEAKSISLSKLVYSLSFHPVKNDRCQKVRTPIFASTKLILNDGTASYDVIKYRRTIRSLQYLSLTRLDIGFASNHLAQFKHQPTISHWQHVKRLVQYLKHTIHFGILLRRQTNLILHGFSDANWGAILMIASLLLTFFWASAGVLESKRQLLVLQLRQSIEPLQLLPWIQLGLNLPSMNLVSSFMILHCFYVIMSVPLNLVSILLWTLR